ncbi:MAG: choice-of-anchor L domain-containing protein [Flavobacteriales bacterium]|jgi:gliding motility-associated-like protein
MKRTLRSSIVLFVTLLSLMLGTNLFAQQVPGTLSVDTAMPIQEMVQNLVGPGVQISNIQVTAANGAYGYYNITGTEIGTSEGIILSTGKAINAVGPNDESGLPQLGPAPTFTCLNCSNYDNNAPGSLLLNQAQTRNTFDAAQIEFDIVPQGDSLRFRYTFASEEYNEWVGSPFNDVFGFYISGPNIGTDVNIALVPNTSTVVAINTVNANTNSQYWVNNFTPPGQGFQFDGFTVDLVAAVGNLIPCETYHLTLVIADGSDRIYDSNVLISQIESNPIVVATTTAGGVDYMIEGCNSGIITFSRNEATPFPQNVTYYIGGNAINGVDYTLLGNGVPGEPISIVIPANQTSVSVPIDAFADQIVEGSEFLTIYLANPLCSSPEFLDSTNFFIEDFLEVDIQPDNAIICNGQCVELTGNAVVQGSSSFVWSPLDNLQNPTTLTPTACPNTTTTYTLTSQVANCISSDEITIGVSFISLGIDSDPVTCPNGGNGSIDLTVLNANPPYTYSWTGPAGFTSDIEDPQNLEDGEYCVEVEDASGCVASGCVTIFELNVLTITDVDILLNGCFPISCFGECDGAVNVSVSGGVAPLTFQWLDASNNVVLNTQNATGLCAGTYTFRVTDAAGCTLENIVVITQPEELFVNLIGTVDVLCDGTSTGSITVDATGGCSPYFYQWAGFPANQTPVLANIPTGNYQVSVTDVNGCSSGNTLDIVVNPPIDPLQVVLDNVTIYPGGFNTSCPGATDGAIEVTASNGTAPYTFEWTNSAGQVIAATEDVSGLACGVYTFTATDANGCEESITVDVTCVPQIQISFTTVSNPCGNENAGLGEIQINSTTGGHGGPYSYVYNGPSCSPCNTEDLLGVNSGAYTLVVTDALGCSREFTINVGTEDFSLSSNVVNATCGNACDGSINVTMTPIASYTYVWTNSNGDVISNLEDVSNLCAGEYFLQVVSGTGCEGFYNFEITEPDPIVISIANVVNPACFGQNNGSIDIEVAGGTGPYTYQWTSNGCIIFGNSAQDINNLLDCCYTVTVTDATGCQVSEEICLQAPQVITLFVSTPSDANGLFDVSCNGASDGSISLTASGGTPDCVAFAPECYFIEWSVDVTQYGNDANASFITGLPGGTYAVNVTDANGCLATTTINLTEPLPILSNPIITPVSCFGQNDGTITPNISGGSGVIVNYLWSPSVAPNANDATTLTNLDPGCYELTIIDSFDCEQTFTYCVDEPQPLTAVADVIQPTPCVGECDGTISVTPSGGTAPYTVTITDELGNSIDGSFISGLCDGTYFINVIDASGCEFSLETVLESPDSFEVLIQPNTVLPGQTFTLNCNGDCTGSLTALITNGVAPFTIVWTNSANEVIGNSETINDLCAGIYCVEVTDASGCIVTECFNITEPPTPLEINSTLSNYPGNYNISCNGACDGSIDLTVTGGVPGYTYLWDDGNGLDPLEDQTNLCAGFYEVLVTDENGCSELLQFELTEPAPIVVNANISLFDGGVNVSCAGACDGSINLVIIGGEPDYTVNWPELSITNTGSVEGLCAGTYTAEITDGIGCTTTEVFTLIEPAPLLVEITEQYNCETGESLLCASIVGGSGTYSVLWENNETTNCITVEGNDEYCVTVTDSNGCETTTCITTDNFSPIAVTAVAEATTCGACNGAITISITGGSGNYNIDWTGTGTIDGDIQQLNLCGGSYSVTVTDDSGCTETIQVAVAGSIEPTVSAEVFGISCFGLTDGGINILFVDATGTPTFDWTYNLEPIPGGEGISNLSEGIYTLSWEDEAGCTGQEQYTISSPDQITIEATLSLYDGGFNVSVNGGSDGAIDIEVEGGTGQYIYDWNHIQTLPEPQDVANLLAGSYTLTVEDANGCTIDSTFVLTEPSVIEWMTGLTPNGDGFNDIYFIRGLEKYRNNDFKVFNRWGNVVYEKTNYNQDWRGQNSDGEELPDGTYFIIFTSGSFAFETYVDLRR